MFIVANRNIVLPSADGAAQHFVPRGYMGEIPDWATKTAYFDLLVSDGKIVVTQSKRDAGLADALDAPDSKPVDEKPENTTKKK